jgi:CelD/BcsL family acetyltransferase involved in cellulose biosynthesis
MPYPETWRWQAARDPRAIEALAPEWDDLVRALGLPFVSGATWLRCFWESFGSPDQGLAVLTAREDDRLVAILPLVRTGRWLRKWLPVANFHSPSLAFAAERPPECAAAAVLDLLVERADVVDLGPVQAGDEFCRTLLEAARLRRLPVVEDSADSDAVIELSGPWEAFRRSLSRNLESSTARHYRQLQRLGKLDFEEVTEADRLPAVLEECFRLEAAGWKADHGSPILARQETLRFYTELAHRSAAAGVLAIYVLRLDGKLIAFEYCLRAGRRIDMLKISYAPELGRYSPGNVLRYLILKTEIERGAIAIYHMGRSSEWKLRWANRVDPLVRLRIYRAGARARCACWSARLRVLLKQCRPVRTAVRWTRNTREAILRRRWTAERAGT